MFTKPSKIIGWTFILLFVLVAFKPYYFFEKRLRWQIEDFIDTYFLYAFLFAMAVWVADLWRDSYEGFKDNCLNYYYKGNWISEEYENLYTNRNVNAWFWIVEKVFFLIFVVVGFILMIFIGEYAVDLYKLLRTDYLLLNIPIVVFGIVSYLIVLYGIWFGVAAVIVFPFFAVLRKYPNMKLSIAIKNYKRANEFLSNPNSLKEALNARVEFYKKQAEINDLGMTEYNRLNEKKS